MIGRTNVTIEDVAREAGVSRAAVSKVIRNAYGVSDAMRERVQAAIDTLGYRPSVAARAMRGSSHTIGIELPTTDNPFFHKLLNAMNSALADTDYQTIISPIVRDELGLLALQRLVDRHVDGIVAVAPQVPLAALERLGAEVPLVLVGRHVDAVHFDTVVDDDLAGGCLVVEHLAGLGHRDIVHLTINYQAQAAHPTSPHSVRAEGYLAGMIAAGLADHSRIVHTDETVEGVRRATLALLDEPAPPTAIFAGHDQVALGVLWARAERGLGPDDLSVVGYDDTDIGSHPLMSLTSVDQSAEVMGDRIAALLLERIAGRTTPARAVVDPELRCRASSAAPKPR